MSSLYPQFQQETTKFIKKFAFLSKKYLTGKKVESIMYSRVEIKQTFKKTSLIIRKEEMDGWKNVKDRLIKDLWRG